MVSTIPFVNGLYLTNEYSYNHQRDVTLKKSKQGMNNAYLWHFKFGHVGDERSKKFERDAYFGAFDYESFATCESCIICKLSKSPFSRTGEQAKGILELIHYDICGMLLVLDSGGSFYFITFIDDFSKFG